MSIFNRKLPMTQHGLQPARLPDGRIVHAGGCKKIDPNIRVVQLKNILKKALIPAKPLFDVDTGQPAVIDGMDDNDTLGDCVIAAQSHQETRLIRAQTRVCLPDDPLACKNTYFAQTGGPDSGLDPITSLKLLRDKGWTFSGTKFQISVFAQVNVNDPNEVQLALSNFYGAQIAWQLPISAQKQTGPGLIWDVSSTRTCNKGAYRPGSWGGHMTYGKSYDFTLARPQGGLITWGTSQLYTYDFMKVYCDGLFVIVPVDVPNDLIDVSALAAEVASVGQIVT